MFSHIASGLESTKSRIFRRDRQVVAPGAKSAVFDCILLGKAVRPLLVRDPRKSRDKIALRINDTNQGLGCFLEIKNGYKVV